MSQLEFGIDLLRYADRLFSNCNETFNQRFTGVELLKIAKACKNSEWDVLPDSWTDDQLQNALLFEEPPRFMYNERGSLVALPDDCRYVNCTKSVIENSDYCEDHQG